MSASYPSLHLLFGTVILFCVMSCYNFRKIHHNGHNSERRLESFSNRMVQNNKDIHERNFKRSYLEYVKDLNRHWNKSFKYVHGKKQDGRHHGHPKFRVKRQSNTDRYLEALRKARAFAAKLQTLHKLGYLTNIAPPTTQQPPVQPGPNPAVPQLSQSASQVPEQQPSNINPPVSNPSQKAQPSPVNMQPQDARPPLNAQPPAQTPATNQPSANPQLTTDMQPSNVQPPPAIPPSQPANNTTKIKPVLSPQEPPNQMAPESKPVFIPGNETILTPISETPKQTPTNPYLPLYPNRRYNNNSGAGPVPNQPAMTRSTNDPKPAPVDQASAPQKPTTNSQKPAIPLVSPPNSQKPRPNNYPEQYPAYPQRPNSYPYQNPGLPPPWAYYPRLPLNRQPVTAPVNNPPLYPPPQPFPSPYPTPFRPPPGYMPFPENMPYPGNIPQPGAVPPTNQLQPPAQAQPAGQDPPQVPPGRTPPEATIPQYGQSLPTGQIQPPGDLPGAAPGQLQPTGHQHPVEPSLPGAHMPPMEPRQIPPQGNMPPHSAQEMPQGHHPLGIPHQGNGTGQNPIQAPVVTDPYTGQRYYPVPGYQPPFTDKLQPHHGQQQPTPGYPYPPPGPFPLPTGLIITEAEMEAREEMAENARELLMMLNAQGHRYTALPPQYSSMLLQMEAEEMDFEDGMFLPHLMPSINPTAVQHPATDVHQGPAAPPHLEHPAYSQAPYWYEGPPYNGMHYYPQPLPTDYPQTHPTGTPPSNQPKEILGLHAQDQINPGLYPKDLDRIVNKNMPTTTITPPLPVVPANIRPTPTLNQQAINRQRYYNQQVYQQPYQRQPNNQKPLNQRQGYNYNPQQQYNEQANYPTQKTAPSTNQLSNVQGSSNLQNPSSKNSNPNQSNQNQPQKGAPSVNKQIALQPLPGGPITPPPPPLTVTQAKGNAPLAGQVAFLNQGLVETTPTTAKSGNVSAVAIENSGMSTNEIIGITVGSILGFFVVFGPLLCLAVRYRKHLKAKKKRFFPRPYSQRRASRGSHDAMETMVISELGKQKLAFDSDGNNQESDSLMPKVNPEPHATTAEPEIIYNNNFGADKRRVMSLTSSKRADSMEISRLLTLKESNTYDKKKTEPSKTRPALPPRGGKSTRGGFPQLFHGSVQMLH